MAYTAGERDDRGLSELVAELLRLGVSLYGFADVSGLFSGVWGEWPRAVSLALALPAEELRDVRSGDRRPPTMTPTWRRTPGTTRSPARWRI